MKKPSECNNLEEIRTQLDLIDAKLIQLVKVRLGYSLAAIPFKRDLEDLFAEDRVVQMMIDRRKWAEDLNLNPDKLEEICDLILTYCRSEMLKNFDATYRQDSAENSENSRPVEMTPNVKKSAS